MQKKFWETEQGKDRWKKMAGKIHIVFLLQQGVMAESFCSCFPYGTLHLDVQKTQDSLQEVWGIPKAMLCIPWLYILFNSVHL